MLFTILHLDGYDSLWDKYHDPNRELHREKRHWVSNNWHLYKSANWETRKELRIAKAELDYITCYKILKEIEHELLLEEMKVFYYDGVEILLNPKTNNYMVYGKQLRTWEQVVDYIEEVEFAELRKRFNKKKEN